MKFAFKVTADTITIITKLNDGIDPAPEVVDTPTYFVWDDADEGFNWVTIERDAMLDKYTVKTEFTTFIVAEK